MNCLNFTQKPKKGYGFIYKYTSPSGKEYIGQTIYSIYERARKDGSGYKNCKVFYSAILKYGIENFIVEILDEVPQEALEEKERFYIEKYGSLLPKGYNYYPGGAGRREDKKSVAIEVYTLDLEYIGFFDSLIKAAEAYQIPWQAISQCINHRIEYYKNWVFVKKGEKPKKPQITKTHGRIIGCYDDDWNLLDVYPSANEAARKIGKENLSRNIRSVCEGKRQHACGFRWKYLD